MTLTACIVLLASVPGIGDAHRALVAHAAHLADAKVGDWVTYRFASAERGAQYLRLAIVEAATDRLGRDAFWIEMEIGEHPSMEAPIAQIRLLAAKDFGLRREGVTRVIAAIGMFSAFTGTLMTPMAAHFNLIPVALLGLPDKYAVIWAQPPSGNTLQQAAFQ